MVDVFGLRSCHDCYSALGGAYHPIELAATTFNIVAWTVGTAVGLLARSLADRLSPTSGVARSAR
jgi:hypothetical protein